jgi:DNA-binding transcriptional MerR regulator
MYKIEQVSRDYEKEGLIKPVRDANTNDRLFSDFDVKQIKRIKSLIHGKGFTIPALKQLLIMASGWNIFECQEKNHCWDVFQCQEKENCEAFKNRRRRCWELRRAADKAYYQKFCTICPFYLVRKTEKISLLETPSATFFSPKKRVPIIKAAGRSRDKKRKDV